MSSRVICESQRYIINECVTRNTEFQLDQIEVSIQLSSSYGPCVFRPESSTVWGVGLWKGFVKCFLKVSIAQQLQYSSTSCGTLRKHFTKPFLQPDTPDCT